MSADDFDADDPTQEDDEGLAGVVPIPIGLVTPTAATPDDDVMDKEASYQEASYQTPEAALSSSLSLLGASYNTSYTMSPISILSGTSLYLLIGVIPTNPASSSWTYQITINGISSTGTPNTLIQIPISTMHGPQTLTVTYPNVASPQYQGQVVFNPV